MIGRNNYTHEEINTARAIIESDLRAYRRLPDSAKTKDFEALFFNREVQFLDYLFAHRLRVVEGKDGGPLIEVRVLCNSLLLNNAKFQIEADPEWPMSAGRSLKLPPEKSVLKLKPGEAINLTEANFVRLSKAFFAALEEKFINPPARPFRRRTRAPISW